MRIALRGRKAAGAVHVAFDMAPVAQGFAGFCERRSGDERVFGHSRNGCAGFMRFFRLFWLERRMDIALSSI
jgi:hypothetical protein